VAKASNELPLGCWVSLFVFAAIIWFLLPNRWTDPIWYSSAYQINGNQVHYRPKPTDCDWSRAPLGDKECHFKKTVTAYNTDGYPVAGDYAPLYNKDRDSGKPIVSYDEGKTWQAWPADTPLPDLKVHRVEIDWMKVPDQAN
jgi:hypothetical protein